MARADFDPLDFGSVMPEEAYAGTADTSQYLPQRPASRSSAAENQNLSYAYDYLLKQGFQPHQAAGIVGNLAQESGGRTMAKGDPSLPGGSLGLAQWNRERLHGGNGYTGLLPFAKAQGLDPSNLYTQLDYMMHELKGPERKALEGLLASKNVDEAARVFGAAYERPNEKLANYENRIAQARQYLGDAPAAPQGPVGETYDIPLSNGQTLTVPKDVDRREAINGLRAQGMDVEGVLDHPLTNGKTLTLPESVQVNDALVDLQKQFPDQEWMTKAHAEKTGFGRVVGTAVKGVGAQFERGAGELLKSPELIAKGKAWQEELAGQVEEPLPTDPLSTKLKYYGGTALGGLAPLGAAVAAAPFLPEAAVIGGLGAATVPIATGSLAQRYDEQGKPFDPYELKNIGAVGAEAALQTLPLGPLGPVAGQFGKSALRGAAGAAAADVPSVAIERAAAGQALTDEKALEEYGGAILADVIGGGALGAAGAFRGRPKATETPELPPVQEGAAPSPVEPAPTGGEALAPTEGPVESVEDLEAQARAGEEFFRQAEAGVAAPEMAAPEMPLLEDGIPEPVVRGREQAMPMVEEAVIPGAEGVTPEAETVTPEPHFAESILGLKPTKAKTSLYNKLQGLDIGNIEDHPKIDELVGKSNIIPGDKLDALSARMKEVEERAIMPSKIEEQKAYATPSEPDIISERAPEQYPRSAEEDQRSYAEETGRGVELLTQRVQDAARIYTEEGRNAAIKDLRKSISSDPEQRAILASFDANREALRASGDYGTIARQTIADLRARSPQGRERLEQLAGQFGAAAQQRPPEGARQGIPREVGEELRTLQGMSELEKEALGERSMYGVLPEAERKQTETDIHPSAEGQTEPVAPSEKPKGEITDAIKIPQAGEISSDVSQFPGESKEVGYVPEGGERVVQEGREERPAVEGYEEKLKAEGVAPEAAHTVETLDQQIKQTYGKEVPRVDVLTREQAGVEPNVKGFYDPSTKRVTLIADNIGKGEDVHGLLRHEVAVHARRLGKSDPEFQAILDRLQSLKDSGDASVARAYDKVPRDTNPEHIHEEALAYLSQHAPNLPIVKSFTSWMRRMAHKLTGSANWLKADDFGPMADAILKRPEAAAPKAEGRMYSVGDAANDAVQNAATENWFERFYTPIRTKVVSVRAPLEAILGKLPLYDEDNEIRATAKIAQQTRYAHLVSEALHTGFLAKNKQGLITAVFDPRLSPDQIINRVMELPEAVRDRFSESMVTLAQAGHNLRGAEMKAVMDEAQRKIKLGQAYLDQTKSRYEKAESKLEEAKNASARAKETTAEYSRNVLATAERNATAATAEIQKIASKVNRGLDVDAEVIDAAIKRQEKAQADLATAKSFAAKLKRTATTDLEKAQREFDAAKAEYRNPNYTAGKDYIATQQRLYRAVKDQFTKAKRNEAGHIYDISPEQERAARQFLETNPEAKQLAADIRELFTNNAKLLRDTSVISNETYKKFTDSKYNYAPLYMSIEDLDAAMPASAVYLQGGQRKVMPVKGLKGSQHQVQFFENLLSHQARTGAMALHNNARLGALESLAEMGRAKELPGTTPPSKGMDVVAAIKDGKRRYYHVPDRPLYEAFEMVHNLPVPSWITDTTKFASRAMLVNPKYWWNQLVREPFMATFTTRAGVITPFHSGKEFASLLFSELPNVDTSAAQLYRELKAQGVSGSHEYLRDLIKEKGKLQASKGLTRNYTDAKDLVMRIHEYADAATKVAVMRKALERAESGKLTGTPLQGEAARDAAITHVGEMINFANRGRSSTVQYITQATPFFNSWAQGMDALVRNATGYGMDPHAKGSTLAGLRTTFIGHAAAMMAFSAAITALRCEFSEDYREADPEEWSANWLIPIPESFETKKGRMVKAKGPFELNTLFKLGPEMWVRNWYGLDRDKDYTATLKSSIWRDIAPPGLDQLFLPYLPMLMLESVTGYSASEGSIKPLADMSLAPAERGKGVSPIADLLSGGPVSPASVKHFGQGFFGGMYDMLDSTAKGAAAAFGSDTARADLRDLTEKVPVISGMLTNPDRIELGSAYEFADKQAMARHTAKVLTKRGEKEEAKEYKEEGRYAKQAEKIKRKISKTNTAIERLKNTKEYEDADKIQRDYETQLEKKRKQVERLEALRTKSEKD